MKVNKKIISIALAVLCLLSCCSFSCFAADDTGNQFYDVLAMSPQMYSVTTDGTVSTSYTSTMQTRQETVNGIDYVGFNNTNRNYYAQGRIKSVIMTDYISISPDKQYSMRFSHNMNYSSPYNITVYVVVYSGGSIKNVPIYEETFNGSSPSWANISDFSFKIPSSTLGTSYKCRLYIEHSVGAPYSYGYDSGTPWQFIQRYIEVVDDDVSWLVKILNAIKAIPSNISGFFTTLGNRISGFFDTVNTKINDFKNNVSSWFSDLKETIKQKFVDLGNDIGEFFEKLKNYLLYFQHPVTTNSDGVLIGVDGKPVYTNPFESALQKVEDTVYDWLGKISNFLDSMEQSRVDVSGYLENGSTLVNGVLKASPALAVCLTFAVGFFVIRKVVGR